MLSALVPLVGLSHWAWAGHITTASVQVLKISHEERETGNFALPPDALQHLGRHMACESEENREWEVESWTPIPCTLPFMRLQNRPVISRIGAVSEQARLSLLHSLALPMLC